MVKIRKNWIGLLPSLAVSFQKRRKKGLTFDIVKRTPMLELVRLRDAVEKSNVAESQEPEIFENYTSQEQIAETMKKLQFMDSGVIQRLSKILQISYDDYDEMLKKPKNMSIRERNDWDENIKDYYENRIPEQATLLKNNIKEVMKRENYPPIVFSGYLFFYNKVMETKGKESAIWLETLRTCASAAIPRSVRVDEIQTLVPDIHKREVTR